MMHGHTDIKLISFYYCYAVLTGNVMPNFGLFLKVTQTWYSPPPNQKRAQLKVLKPRTAKELSAGSCTMLS